MIVSCDNCAARYKLDPNRITGRGVRITCPKCKNVFVVYNQDRAEEEQVIETAPAPDDSSTPAAPPQAAAPKAAAPKAAAPKAAARKAAAPKAAASAPAASTRSPRPDIGALDFTTVGIQAWKVKVAIGLVYDFSDYKTLARYIKDGRVGEGDQISHDGRNWTVLGDIDDLEEHFFLVYEEAERLMNEGGAEEEQRDAFDDDSPTMIVGAASVADSLKGVANIASGADDAPSTPVATQEDDTGGLSAAMSAALQAESTGAPEEARGPRFQDPFAKARSERSSSGRRRRSSGSTGKSGQSGKSGGSSGKNKRGLVTFVVAGILLGGGGYAAYMTISAQRAEADLKAEQAKAARQAQLQAQQQKVQDNAGKAMEQKIQQELKKAIETVQDEGSFTEPEDDILIPIGGPGPDSRPSSGSSSSGSSTTAVDLGSGTSGTMSTSAATPEDHFDAGRTAYNSGNYSAAVGAFSKATAGAPTNGNYYKWLGLAQMKRGDGSAAASLAKGASLGAYDAYIYLGDISASQGDVAGAIGYYEQYLSHDPGNASVQSKIDALTR